MDQEIYPDNQNEPDAMPAGGSEPPPPAPHEEQDVMPGAKPSAVGRLKSQKWLLFALIGCLGGVAGSAFAELAPGDSANPSFIETAMKTGIWFAMAASFLAVGLFMANEIYLRHNLHPRFVQRGLFTGAVGGMIAGFIAQALFSKMMTGEMSNTKIYAIYSICWGVLGALLGVGLAGRVPNLGVIRGIGAGAVGGAIGGTAFVFFGDYFVADDASQATQNIMGVVGRMAGIGLLGAALGLAMVVVESLFNEATLEVVWAPNETTKFNLGADPIYIGGGPEDQIYVRGFGERHASVLFSNGIIEFIDGESQNRTPLKNGSHLQIGTVKLIIHAAK